MQKIHFGEFDKFLAIFIFTFLLKFDNKNVLSYTG